MAGLRRLCKALGGMTVIGNDGARIDYVWDYVADEPVRKEEMPFGSARHAASERAKYMQLASVSAAELNQEIKA